MIHFSRWPCCWEEPIVGDRVAAFDADAMPAAVGGGRISLEENGGKNDTMAKNKNYSNGGTTVTSC